MFDYGVDLLENLGFTSNEVASPVNYSPAATVTADESGFWSNLGGTVGDFLNDALSVGKEYTVFAARKALIEDQNELLNTVPVKQQPQIQTPNGQTGVLPVNGNVISTGSGQAFLLIAVAGAIGIYLVAKS